MHSDRDTDLSPVFNESGLEIKPVYTAQDVDASGGATGIGRPGEFPVTRGSHRSM